MPDTKTHTIDDLILNEVSVVDNPGNQFALMALWKSESNPQGDNDMTIEELKKALEAANAKVDELTTGNADLQKRLEEAEAAQTALTKALDEAEITVETKDGEVSVAKAAEPEYIEVDGEKVLKSSVPAPLLKQLEKQSKDIDELKKANESVALAKRAEETFPNLGGTGAEKAALIKMLDGLEGDEKAALEKSLKAADAAVSKMFDEVGQGGNSGNSEAQDQLNSMVEKYADEHNVTKAAAFTEVVKAGEGRKLLLKSRAEAN